jgi:hypothetical protein
LCAKVPERPHHHDVREQKRTSRSFKAEFQTETMKRVK